MKSLGFLQHHTGDQTYISYINVHVKTGNEKGVAMRKFDNRFPTMGSLLICFTNKKSLQKQLTKKTAFPLI